MSSADAKLFYTDVVAVAAWESTTQKGKTKKTKAGIDQRGITCLVGEFESR
jgi:hypothetical protein